MKELIDICRVPIRFSDIDSMQRVWHGSYVTYLEDGRESFGKHYPGIGYADMQRIGIYAPIYDMHIKYFAPLMLNDVAIIHTQYIYRLGARLDYAYKIYRASDQTLCAEGTTIQLFIDPQGVLIVDKPEYYQTWQDKYLF
ncbi:MAG: acyl-CoA thioesterase [Parabacteroides distasonis]|nr:acyl-CoA thioesterase [Parabacteroides distasonis]